MPPHHGPRRTDHQESWWLLSGGRRRAGLVAVFAYVGCGVVSLALLAVLLYCGILPARPVTGGVSEFGVTLRVLGIAAGIPDGGWA